VLVIWSFVMLVRKGFMLICAAIAAIILVLAGPAHAGTTYGSGGLSGASILMGPATQTVSKTSLAKINVTIDTKAHSINAYQFEIVFPDGRLDCTNIASVSSAFNVAAVECTGNRARFAAGTPAGAPPFKGKAVVASVTYKPTGVLGQANLSFGPAITMVVATPSATDVTGAMNTSIIRVVS